MADAKGQTDIRDFSFEEAEQYFLSVGEKSFRATQVFEWIYKKNAQGFEEMANLPKALRDRLSADFIFDPQVVVHQDVSVDGTTKFLFDLKDHQKVETVLIPTETRATACISTQAGCKFGCRFCASGIAGWTRNLNPSEIVAQVIHAKREAKSALYRTSCSWASANRSIITTMSLKPSA